MPGDLQLWRLLGPAPLGYVALDFDPGQCGGRRGCFYTTPNGFDKYPLRKVPGWWWRADRWTFPPTIRTVRILAERYGDRLVLKDDAREKVIELLGYDPTVDAEDHVGCVYIGSDRQVFQGWIPQSMLEDLPEESIDAPPEAYDDGEELEEDEGAPLLVLLNDRLVDAPAQADHWRDTSVDRAALQSALEELVPPVVRRAIEQALPSSLATSATTESLRLALSGLLGRTLPPILASAVEAALVPALDRIQSRWTDLCSDAATSPAPDAGAAPTQPAEWSGDLERALDRLVDRVTVALSPSFIELRTAIDHLREHREDHAIRSDAAIENELRERLPGFERLHLKSRCILVEAERTRDLFVLYEAKDWTPIVNYCQRVVEIEAVEKLFRPWRMQARANCPKFRDPKLRDRLVSDNHPHREFGNLRHLLYIVAAGAVRASDADRDALSDSLRACFPDDYDLIVNRVQMEIEDFWHSYRNKASHTGLIERQEADNARGLVLGSDTKAGLLRLLLSLGGRSGSATDGRNEARSS